MVYIYGITIVESFRTGEIHKELDHKYFNLDWNWTIDELPENLLCTTLTATLEGDNQATIQAKHHTPGWHQGRVAKSDLNRFLHLCIRAAIKKRTPSGLWGQDQPWLGPSMAILGSPLAVILTIASGGDTITETAHQMQSRAQIKANSFSTFSVLGEFS